ncbi:MAG: prefoldin subunit beta [bacterium]
MAEPQLTPALQQQLAQLQSLNQQYQMAAQQRQQFEAMKAESEQALEALGTLPDDAPVYRSVGSLLVKEPSKKAAADRLKDDLETLEVRLARVQKQESQTKEQMAALQSKLQAALQPKPGK